MTPLRFGHRAPLLALLVACSTGKPLDPNAPLDLPAAGRSSAGGSSGTSAVGGSSAAANGGSGAAGGGARGGAGGTTAMGGASAMSGAGGGAGGDSAATGGSAAAGSAASGGDAGSGTLGGTGGANPTGGAGGTDPGICQDLEADSTPQIPTVELVVDTSSSMWQTEPPAWPLLYAALMDPTNGVVAALESKIRFGFASYKGFKASSETDPACATMTTVDPALDNHDAIDAVYQQVSSTWDPVSKPKWETPTDYAINYAATILTNYDPMPPGKKYILLVTDGNPNTCQVTDPQCGQDLAIKAAQDAYAAGIGLFVLGVGDIVAQPDNGCPTAARCGLLHLQDLANAGVGAGVHPTPGCDDWHDSGCTFTHEQCNQDQTLKATYTPDAPDVGTPYTVDTSSTNATTKLVETLSGLLTDTAACTVDMDAVVQGDPALGVVTLGGTTLAYGDADGWKLEDNHYSVTLQGAACRTFEAGAKLDIKFPCDPSGNPVAVHR